MHRRQYMPGSHIKTSRAQFARYNAALSDEVKRMAAEAAERRNAEAIRMTSGIRGLLHRAKRVLVTPLRFGRVAM